MKQQIFINFEKEQQQWKTQAKETTTIHLEETTGFQRKEQQLIKK